MNDTPKCKGITTGFNFLFALYILFESSASVLFESERSSHALIDDYFAVAPVTTSIAVILAVSGSIFLGPFFILEFWNRLIAGLFPVRCLFYREAFSICLMLALLSI